MLGPEDFFDLEGSHLKGLFKNTEFVWEGLKNINKYIEDNIVPNVSDLRRSSSLLDKDMVIHNGEVLKSGFTINSASGTVSKDGIELKGASIIYAGVFLADDEIYIGRGTVIESGALIKGPAIIGDDNEIRQGAYIRGNVIVGNKCVVGHTTEMKTAVMLGESKAGHFAYLGDSILGKVNLGAGTKLANLKIFESKIDLTVNGKKYETEPENDLNKVNSELNNAYCLKSYFDISDKLNKEFSLYHYTFRNGYYAWEKQPNKTISHDKFIEQIDKEIVIIYGSISSKQTSLTKTTNFITANVRQANYSILKDSISTLPIDYRPQSGYFDKSVYQMSKANPEYFYKLLQDFPTSKKFIYFAVDQDKELIKQLKQVQGYDDLKKEFFKEYKYGKTMPYRIIGTYAIIAGLLTWLIIAQP